MSRSWFVLMQILDGHRGPSLHGKEMMITFDKAKKMFYINTKDSSYIFGLNCENRLYNAYYGRRLSAAVMKKIAEPAIKEVAYHMVDNMRSNYMPELNIYDGYNVFENTVKVTLSNGVKSLDCVYLSHAINQNKLTVRLKDRFYGIEINLGYTVHYEYNLMEKTLEIINNDKKLSSVIETFNSGDLMLPPGKYNLGYFHGGWIKEMSLRFEEISYGRKVIESRTGHSSHIHNPSFFITKEAKPQEEEGEYYYGQLMWGGGFKFTFEKRMYDSVNFTGGINSFDGFPELKPGGKLTAPALLLGYSDKGLGKMSRNLHDFYRDKVLNRQMLKDEKRILSNSWEAFYFSTSEEKLLRLADRAKEAGAEILVVDDGWFRRRDNDGNSLGDWRPIKEKFPNGMREFGKKIKAKGLKFGIWLEPECMNTDSDLYRKHPGWCYRFEGRTDKEMRHTVTLDITKKPVQKYLKGMIRRVMTEYEPDYVKWDMNRYVSETGIFKGSQAQLEHVKAAYELMDYLKSLKPSVILEGCAGGGGRMSGGYLAHVDQMWASDNNDPFCRQIIQYGTSLFYPAIVMCCHVADSPYCLTGRKSTALFRIRTAMAGNLGTEANLLEWSDKDLAVFGREIGDYKCIRDIIYYGDLYRLESPYESTRVSLMYVSKDKKRAAVFSYNVGIELTKSVNGVAGSFVSNPAGNIVLRGLKTSYIYELKGGGRAHGTAMTGKDLMTKGVNIAIKKVQDSAVIILERRPK